MCAAIEGIGFKSALNGELVSARPPPPPLQTSSSTSTLRPSPFNGYGVGAFGSAADGTPASLGPPSNANAETSAASASVEPAVAPAPHKHRLFATKPAKSAAASAKAEPASSGALFRPASTPALDQLHDALVPAVKSKDKPKKKDKDKEKDAATASSGSSSSKSHRPTATTTGHEGGASLSARPLQASVVAHPTSAGFQKVPFDYEIFSSAIMSLFHPVQCSNQVYNESKQIILVCARRTHNTRSAWNFKSPH